jgi:hypothetical protein
MAAKSSKAAGMCMSLNHDTSLVLHVRIGTSTHKHSKPAAVCDVQTTGRRIPSELIEFDLCIRVALKCSVRYRWLSSYLQPAGAGVKDGFICGSHVSGAVKV